MNQLKQMNPEQTKDDFKRLSYREQNQKAGELIQKQIGNIEEVRESLGLSKRKMCQMLLIDPSTWSRWATGKTPVPPHVYRMLQWGLAVMDKAPELHPLHQQGQLDLLKRIGELEKNLSDLKMVNDSKHSSFLSWVRGLFFFKKT